MGEGRREREIKLFTELRRSRRFLSINIEITQESSWKQPLLHPSLQPGTHVRVTATFASTFAQFAASQGSSKRSSGAHLAKMLFEPGLARKIQSHFRREGGCGEPRKPIRSYERCPQPFELQMRCSLYVRDVKLRGAARNPRANPHEHSIPLGQGWSSGGCSALVSCAPNRKSGPLIHLRVSLTTVTICFQHRYLDQRGADRPRGCTNVLGRHVPRMAARCGA